MKLFKIALTLCVLTYPLTAQDAPEPVFGWQNEVIAGMTLTQTQFDNWTAGGENSLAWQFNLNYKFVNDQASSNWATSGQLVYGTLKQNETAARKSVDEIKFESVYKYKLGFFVNPYAALNAETQMAAGYDYGTDTVTQISAYMDPGYFRESFGVGYQHEELVKTRLGLSFKQTRTTDYPVPFADDPSTPEIETTRSEVGLESVTDMNWPLAENSQLSFKLELFTAFDGFDAMDVSWDNLLSTKIGKVLSINFNLKLLYDEDLSAKRQLNQSLAFGLTYTLL